MSYERLLDTNVIIHYLNENKKAVELVNRLGPKNAYISNMVLMELYAGPDNKDRLNALVKKLNGKFSIIADHEYTMVHARKLFYQYHLSHKPDIADCIIASTALFSRIPLISENRKDFDFIPHLKLEIFKR